MNGQELKRCTAFEGSRCIASGDLAQVAKKVKATVDRNGQGSVLIFDDVTSEMIEVDFRGTLEDVLKRLEQPASKAGPASVWIEPAQKSRRGPGRPKLGIVSREVTLLPRHWDWLNRQPGGASVALRKLVEQARRMNSDQDKIRQAQEATYRFMSAMAGNLPGFEEATRALFAANPEPFEGLISAWPGDIQDHTRKLAETAFRNRPSPS
jgi:uncharacterized protein